ncbi:MAG: hypothetical protein ACQEWU_16820 [Bacillota bacterium]
MGYPFYNEAIWKRKARNAYFSSLAVMVILWLQISENDFYHPAFVVISSIFAFFSLVQGIHYQTMWKKDYIRMEDNEILIYRGLCLPRKRISFEDIKRFKEVSTLIELHLKEDKHAQFNIDWLSNHSVKAIKETLCKKIHEEMDAVRKKEHYHAKTHY